MDISSLEIKKDILTTIVSSPAIFNKPEINNELSYQKIHVLCFKNYSKNQNLIVYFNPVLNEKNESNNEEESLCNF